MGSGVSKTFPGVPNSKSLQAVVSTEDAIYKLARSNYYKFRASNLMFGFNTNIMLRMRSFNEFNALRKNQLLAFHAEIEPLFKDCLAGATTNK